LLANNNFRTKIGIGAGLGKHPYLSLQPIKLATSNLVHNLGLASSLSRNNY